MSITLKALQDQVVVITGASSGIGLETAKRAAARGAKVVLAARDGDALKQVEREITDAGGVALAVPTDVSKPEEVQRLADAALTKFGGFDTWINNAGLSVFGKARTNRRRGPPATVRDQLLGHGDRLARRGQAPEIQGRRDHQLGVGRVGRGAAAAEHVLGE